MAGEAQAFQPEKQHVELVGGLYKVAFCVLTLTGWKLGVIVTTKYRDSLLLRNTSLTDLTVVVQSEPGVVDMSKVLLKLETGCPANAAATASALVGFFDSAAVIGVRGSHAWLGDAPDAEMIGTNTIAETETTTAVDKRLHKLSLGLSMGVHG